VTRVAAPPRVAAVAFGAEPGAPVRVRPGAPPLERWYVAVALGGQGCYAAAAAALEPLLVRPAVPVAVAAHAAVTLAAHRRQLGGHVAARPYDALGLRLACSVRDDPHGLALAARLDALVGLAADAVGTAAPDTAKRLLYRANELLERANAQVTVNDGGDHSDWAAVGDEARSNWSWRPSVRLGWVRAELALACGDAAGAVEPARAALGLARVAGSVRHVLKSRIVLAVAEAVAGASSTKAVAELDAAAESAEQYRLLPLVWPARLAAADLLERGATVVPDANDGVTKISQKAVSDRVDGAARRRHAALATLSVIRQRADPIGKRLLGESYRVPAPPPVM
jgi:hypothetical protein